MKHCTKCKEEKPLELFNKGLANADGYSSVCKGCHSLYYDKEYQAKRARNKAMKKWRSKKKLEASPPPDVDTVLHTAAVKVADELTRLNSNSDLNQADISKMKSLMDILLLVRKNARPKKEKKEEKVEPANDELFE